AESIEAIAAFHEQHHREASGLQRRLEKLADFLGRPWFAVVALLAVISWVVVAAAEGGLDPRQDSLTWLQILGTLLAAFMTIVILTAQRRQDQLADRRARLTLEVAIL